MTDLPLTRIAASEARQCAIRNAVSTTESLAGMAHVAGENDVAALTEMLSDPAISQPIYTLPTTIDHESVAEFIARHLDERKRGEGLLMVGTDEAGHVTAYYDIQFWPEWAACELGGAVSSKHQNSGRGGAGALEAFTWLFDAIGVDLICETAALDNVRTARLLDRIGFTCLGEIQSKLPSGGTRPSRYWELKKSEWLNIKSNGDSTL